MILKRVVVTGLGALTPIGNTVKAYWDALEAGQSGAALITKFDTTKFKTKFACELKGIKMEDFLDRKELRRMDAFCHYALVAVDEAVRDSGIDVKTVDCDRVGVIWGSGIGGIFTFQEEMYEYFLKERTPRFNPFFIPKMIIDICPGHISIKYGFRGPNFSAVSACASSTNAIVDAYNYIRLGKANVIVTGGSEASITEAGIGGFNALKALSERNDSPETASRPFDKDRDGFVMGEGAGALILEELEHAKARGAKIYAEIIGGGATGDAYHMTAPHPEGLGAKNVMLEALRDNNTPLESVDYINVHGTSTPLGDECEINAILGVFGEHTYNLNISSTKSMTGHLLGAAGAVEAIAGIMSLERQVIPPTINHFTFDPEFDSKINYTFNKAQKRKVDVVLSNTFGFGGHNATILMRKYKE
ncbi:MAG: beta-ketoacyl-[acyl-carrier-protein] synthase II [Cytophagales bacterium]|nr:MAG: beta-ketoacyl-[acyl-carrier-protein] synthase II [Cytophagales bacterium]TAF60169.1 MAG: beta-ketoacyl-[acyl-carrier-protein] synthase II [Cytophagales bacterium]